MSRMRTSARAVVILLLAGCTGDATSPVGPLPDPASTISDAAHAGEVPGFYFLPPMVKQPAYSGTFDAALSPTVHICELAGTTCAVTLATYTMTSGVGNEVVRLQAGSELYQVNWHTNQFSLDPAKHYRIEVYSGTLRLGFADVDVVSSGSQLRNVQTQEYIALLDGRTLPIKFRIETGIVGWTIKKKYFGVKFLNIKPSQRAVLDRYLTSLYK
jgi:hypothetical protein